jgi:hypothetical protein
MGRKSKLSPAQWEEVKRQHYVHGQSVYSLAKEYGLTSKSIWMYFRKQLDAASDAMDRGEIVDKSAPNGSAKSLTHKEIIHTAAVKISQFTQSELGLAEDDQRIALELANVMNRTREGLSVVADNNVYIARLISTAAKKVSVNLITPDGLIDMDLLKQLAAMIDVTNRASSIGIEAVKSDKTPVQQEPVQITGGLPD